MIAYNEIKAFIFAFKLVLNDACRGHRITSSFYSAAIMEKTLSSTPN